MLLILLLSQHLFVTSLQGRVLPNFEEESSRPVIPQLLAELPRWLVLAPMIRASSFYDLVPQDVRKIHDGGLMPRHLPFTRLVKRGRETEGLWGPGGRAGARVGRAPERVQQGLMQVFKPFFARSSPQKIGTRQHDGSLERIFK